MKVGELIRLLEEDGWRLARTLGSHRQYKNPDKPGTVTVAGELSLNVPPGTLNAILKQALSPAPAAQRLFVRPTTAMKFPRELEDAAFRSSNGEYAWQQSEALDAVRILAGSGRAVLGGELWLVRDGEIWGGLPQRSGPPGVYAWETERLPEEPWPAYVARASGQALLAIQGAPAALREHEVSVPSQAKVYYNLTWAGADE